MTVRGLRARPQANAAGLYAYRNHNNTVGANGEEPLSACSQHGNVMVVVVAAKVVAMVVAMMVAVMAVVLAIVMAMVAVTADISGDNHGGGNGGCNCAWQTCWQRPCQLWRHCLHNPCVSETFVK